MNTLQKNITLNRYSEQLFSEFKPVAKQFDDDTVRNRLFENENLLKFINNVQTVYQSVVYDDTQLNSIMSSAIHADGRFKYKYFMNDYQKTRGVDASNDYFEFTGNFNSKYMATNASHIINNKQLFTVEFTGDVCGIHLNIRFHSDQQWFKTDSKKKVNIELYQKVVRILRRILFVIKFFEKNVCFKDEHLVFDLFLIDSPKTLPTSRLAPLDQESINSGFTTFFNDGKNTKTIIIYRGEEMDKLVIHELIHFFFLDFKHFIINLSLVLNVSPNTEFISNEAFTEYLTIIIQSGLIPIETQFKNSNANRGVLNTTKVNIDMKLVFHHALEILYHEIIFGYLQCAKILFQYNIKNTSDFFKPYDSNDKLFFYQKSCILSYFFIKVAMLTNIDESFLFYVSNQTNYKIATEERVQLKLKDVMFSSLQKQDYQHNIQRALIFINKVVFNKQVVSKINHKCKTKKKCCVKQSYERYKTRLSFKRSDKKSVKHLILNTRMSLFEL